MATALTLLVLLVMFGTPFGLLAAQATRSASRCQPERAPVRYHGQQVR